MIEIETASAFWVARVSNDLSTSLIMKPRWVQNAHTAIDADRVTY